MHKFAWLTLFAIFILATGAAAQQNDDLSAEDVEVVNTVDTFGQTVFTAIGQLRNTSASDAYGNISLHAEAYDAADALVGEGFGVLVNACAVSLLPGFTLQPGEAQLFSAQLELLDPELEIARVEVTADAEAVEPASAVALADGITQVTDDEAVNVEWINDHSLRYATGCETDLFLDWDWYTYNIQLDAQTEIVAPHASDANDDMRARLELQDDAEFAHSMMRYAPDGDRLVYQNAINEFLTAYVDGRVRRGLYTGLNNRSLRGIYWQPNERFIAYYYGAYGDPVYYFVADAEARVVSPALPNNPPSVIVPGLSRDGRRVALAGEFDGVLGYYLYVVTNNFFELQFEAEPPGNNFPAPLLVENAETELISQIYVARLENDAALLQCYNRDQNELHDLAPLPLNLADDERAWWWMSPDETQIALAADGVNGGLWLIDLTALPACE